MPNILIYNQKSGGYRTSLNHVLNILINTAISFVKEVQ